jgi:hypothetical protein
MLNKRCFVSTIYFIVPPLKSLVVGLVTMTPVNNLYYSSTARILRGEAHTGDSPIFTAIPDASPEFGILTLKAVVPDDASSLANSFTPP